jgi:hypothetical protein
MENSKKEKRKKFWNYFGYGALIAFMVSSCVFIGFGIKDIVYCYKTWIPIEITYYQQIIINYELEETKEYWTSDIDEAYRKGDGLVFSYTFKIVFDDGFVYYKEDLPYSSYKII